MGTRVVLATANQDKAVEIVEILRERLGDAVEIAPRPESVPEVDETGDTLEENARLKAAAIGLATDAIAIADDTGLEVDALGGAPGVYSARYAGEHASYESNVAKLVAALHGIEDRRARFRTVAIARFPDGRELCAEGAVEGAIAEVPRGDRGFGYDPVFVVEGGNRTFAEMSPAEKHARSHRGRAFTKLASLLSDALEL